MGSSFYPTFIATVGAPIVLMIWFCFISGFQYLFDEWSKVKDNLINSLIVVTWLSINDVYRVIFQSVACVDNRLMQDLEVICWEGTHLIIVLAVTLPSVLAFVIIGPLTIAMKIRNLNST